MTLKGDKRVLSAEKVTVLENERIYIYLTCNRSFCNEYFLILQHECEEPQRFAGCNRDE